jgi:arylsulfatase A-like enzyme
VYDNSLAYLDSQVGRLVDYMKTHGLWENTIFVLTGDHGQAFYEHGFAAHGNVPYAELARAPLIIHAPSLSPGLDDRPTQHVDVPPTILSLLGLPPHPAFQGIDLVGPRPPNDRPLFVVAQTPIANAYSMVDGRYTLILDDFTGLITLYDDAADPAQKRDISRTRRALRDSLLHKLDMWRRVQLLYYAHAADSTKTYPPDLVFWDRDGAPGLIAGDAEQHSPTSQLGRE